MNTYLLAPLQIQLAALDSFVVLAAFVIVVVVAIAVTLVLL